MRDTERAERLAVVADQLTTLRAERLAVVADQLTTLRAERDELIRALRDHGWTLERIAQHAGITAQAIHKVLKKENTNHD